MAKALVVDDETVVRRITTSMLEAAGFSVEQANDGNQAMVALKTGQYDLLVTDIIMPNKEGIETIMEARKLRPDMKIVAMSGGGRIGNTQVLDIAKKAGADGTVGKPFKKEDLLKEIVRIMSS